MALSAEQELIRDTVRSFVEREVEPAVEEADANQEFPESVWDSLADLDLTGLTVPEEYGGFDADQLTASIVYEELAAGHLSLATALSVHSLATSCLREFGTQAHIEDWLPGRTGVMCCENGRKQCHKHDRKQDNESNFRQQTASKFLFEVGFEPIRNHSSSTRGLSFA